MTFGVEHTPENEKIALVREYLESGLGYRKFFDKNKGKIPVRIRQFGDWCHKYRDVAKLKDGYVPERHEIKGTSTLYDSEGNVKMTWVKTSKEIEDAKAVMLAALDEAKEDLPKIKDIKRPKKWDENLAAVIPIGDAHFGMLAWHEETGNDFDLNIAKRDLCGAMKYLIDSGPACDTCVIANVGDMLHYSTMKPITEASGHVLSADSRAQKMVRVTVSALRFAIEYAAQKHNKVVCINSSGNHDGLLAHIMNIMLANIYEGNKRIAIMDQPTSRHYFQHGKVLIGVVHGHQTKDRDLPGIMATERPEQWGQTKHRTWIRGHHHHDSRVEYNGCIVEQVRTLAAGDDYAVSSGFLSGRDIKQILFHKEFGEVGRNICGIDLLRSLQVE